MYPDILVFRRTGGRLHVDLLDPHDSGRADAVDKAVGLARFADKHGDLFGRIELIVLNGRDEIKRLDVNRDATRRKVMAVKETGHLQFLFDEHG